MSRFGRSLQLYFVDGRPDGMLTAEVFNWTGHVLMAPRTQIADALRRSEARHTGVYLLLGEREGSPLCYIGEAEDLASRIQGHVHKKDWWTDAVLITSSADSLHKAHVKYLEARMVEEAKKIGRIRLENGNMPPRSSLSEADVSNMEAFLDTLRMVLSAVRVDLLLEKRRPSVTAESLPENTSRARFVYESPKHSLRATATLENGEFVVHAGSLARREWSGTDNHSYRVLHAELIANGVLIQGEKFCTFDENYAFASPSAAGAVVVGRATNGPKNWKLEADGRSYREWESDELDKGIVRA